MGELMIFVACIHLALPVTGLLFLAMRRERKAISIERRKLLHTFLVMARGRRGIK